MTPISWEDLIAHPSGPIPFLITPYLPCGGIILLYGKTRTGKSPLTWELARCVGSGEPLFGRYPATQATVLYLELDTPQRLVQPRLTLLPPAPNVWWEFMPAINIFDHGSQVYLRSLHLPVPPQLVIVNTLRAVHYGDEKDGALPLRVYKTFQAIFPGAAILFVHHDKKSSGNPEDSSDPDEAFSGHQAWFNHCQTGLHLVRHGGSQPGLLRLVHSKSQVSPEATDLVLQLNSDGSQLTDFIASKLKDILTVYQALGDCNKSEKVRLCAKQLNMSERNVWTYLSRVPESP